MKWNKTEDVKPIFGRTVLVRCRVYGYFLASFEEIANSGHGNWRHEDSLGILPPTHWCYIEEPEDIK